MFLEKDELMNLLTKHIDIIKSIRSQNILLLNNHLQDPNLTAGLQSPGMAHFGA